MKVKISKVGNSLSLRIPKRLALALHVEDGTMAEVSIENDVLTVKPERYQYQLKDLLKGITKDTLHAEIDTGESMGAEAVDAW